MKGLLLVVSIVAYAVLVYFNLRCFFYQRTLVMLERRYGINLRNIRGIYPKGYLIGYNVSKLRIIALGCVAWIKWPIALVLAALKFIIAILAKVNHNKHLKTLQHICSERYDLLQIYFYCSEILEEEKNFDSIPTNRK